MRDVERLKVPIQLIDLHFRVVKARGKVPDVEKAWQTKNNYAVSDEQIKSILASGLNYGFTCPTGFACFIDADTKEIQDILDASKWTFRYSTGTPGHFQYAYFIEDEPIGCVPLKDGAYIKGKGGFTVGPGSIHPNGNVYGKDIRYAQVATVRKTDLLLWLAPFLKKEEHVSHAVPSMSRKEKVTDKQIDEQVQQLLDLWTKADGHRHDLTLSLVGFYQKRGWELADIDTLFKELVGISKKGEEHLKTISNAFYSNSHKWGLPMILAIEKEVQTRAH